MLFLKELKMAFKSKEYWIAISFVFLSVILTGYLNLNKVGIFSDITIGASDFFIASTIIGNSMLQVFAPLIATISCAYLLKTYPEKKDDSNLKIFNHEEKRVKILSTIVISSSVFMFSLFVIFLLSIVFLPPSQGNIKGIMGLFENIYAQRPLLYIGLYILHSSVFGSIYGLFSMSLAPFFIRNKSIAIFLPFVFYHNFHYILFLVPKPISFIFSWISPLITYDIATIDVPFAKHVFELLFVLLLSIALLIVDEKKYKSNK